MVCWEPGLSTMTILALVVSGAAIGYCGAWVTTTVLVTLGVAVLVTTPGSAVQIGNDSVLKINALAFKKTDGDVSQREAHLQLTSGVVSALIDPSTPKVTDFQVATPEGAAAARGTYFAVLVYHGKTYVGVKEGKVGAVANGN